jgi:hypothetical protein
LNGDAGSGLPALARGGAERSSQFPAEESMRSSINRIGSALKTVRELIDTMWRGPYWWLVPLILFLLPAALIFVVLQAAPLAAPFVYTFF